MPIRVLDSPEPLSAQSMLADVDCILVQSDASRLLLQELKRYRDRQVTGRSFLIAGHRGSGKTTLVLDAYMRVLKESQRFSLPTRLLLVPLHGPNLLPEPAEAAAVADDAKAPKREADFDTETQRVLKQITLALYRALAGEVSSSYRQRVLERVATNFVRLPELLEIAAQLELELYDCPDAARLRAIWDRGGFLHSGVLSPRRTSAPGLSADTGNSGNVPDRGLLEIVALASACEAYKRVAGTYTTKDEKTEEAKHSQKQTTDVDVTKKELLSALIAIGTGGLTGAAMFNGENGVVAALGGLIAAIGSSIVIKISSTRSRDRSRKREQTFVFDLTTPTLDRVLPLICERVARAGLMPVFMVDELDKVEDLHERMGSMVRHLKKFVAESAFFCFLTDRSYFEQLRLKVSMAAHPAEETYFKHPLVVVFTARDLHAYLERVIERPKPQVAENTKPENLEKEAPAETDLERQARVEQAVARESQQKPASSDLTDYPLISYVLLHRARMHAGGLQRELASLTNEKGEFALPPGSIRTLRACRFDLLIQLAIEYVLDQSKLREAMEREPERRMLVHDAMYYISRKWADGATTLDLSEAGQPAFRKYLLGRIASGLEKSEAVNGIELKEDTELELLSYVRDLAALIASPQDLKRKLELAETRPDTVVIDAIPLPGTSIGLILEPDPERVDFYRWLYRYTGQEIVLLPEPVKPALVTSSPSPEIPRPPPQAPVAPSVPPEIDDDAKTPLEPPVSKAATSKRRSAPAAGPGKPPAEVERWEEAATFIRAYGDLLTKVSTKLIDFATLSSQFRVIRTSPAWEEVVRAFERLERNRRSPGGTRYREYDDDVSCVIDFESLLNDSMATIGAALVCGALIGKASRGSKMGTSIYLGLKTIAEAYGFANATEGEVFRSLEKVGAFFFDKAPFGAEPFPWGLSKMDLEVHREKLIGLIDRVGKLEVSRDDLEDAEQLAWNRWKTRLPMITAPSLPLAFPPEFEDLLCGAANVRPSNLLQLRPGEMTARNWSNAIYWSLADIAITNPHLCKTWVAPGAFRALGMSVRDPVSVDNMLADRARDLKESELQSDPHLYWSIPTPPLISVLIVVAEKESITASWLASTRGAALLLSAEQIERLLKKHGQLLDMLGIDHVVFEELLDEAIEKRLLQPATRSPERATIPLNVWRFSAKVTSARQLNLPNRMPEVQRPNQLVAPKDLDDLFDQIFAALGRPQR